LELHLLILVVLLDNLLLALPLPGRCAVSSWLLLLLLVKLFRKLLDLLTLLNVVVPIVVHWAPLVAVVTAGRLV
jgi:hypothetical protein